MLTHVIMYAMQQFACIHIDRNHIIVFQMLLIFRLVFELL